MTRRGRRVETVVGWFAQLAMLAGLPLALWTLTGNPIPSRLPSWLDVQDWWAGAQLYPASALDIVPRIVADALWIVWAWYTAWILLGLLWELLHLPAILLPQILLRLTPRATVHAITVGAVAATPTVHAAPAPAHTGQGAAPLPAHLSGRLTLAAVAPSPLARPGHPLNLFTPVAAHNSTVHRVVHGDTLWDLAVRYYGDGEAWHRIYHASLERPQPDGARLTDPDLIQPGWTLTIPDPAVPSRIPAPPPDRRGPAHPAGRTPAPHGTRSPDATAPGTAAHRPTAPAPGRTRATAPTAPGTGPAPRPAPPRPTGSVGYHLPDGGYIGITLIAAIASAVALLKTRQRLHPDTAPPIPKSAEHLAAVYNAARHAHTHGHHPARDHTQSPLLFAPQPGLPTLGTYPDHAHEASYPSDARTGPLLFTGPGASDAARALALSLLGAGDLDDDLPAAQSPLGLQVLLTDQKLAADLFDAHPDQHLPGWLHLTATSADAAAQFYTAAQRRAASGTDAEEFQPTEDEPYTALLLRADPSLHDTIVQACLTDPTGSLSAFVLGPPPQDPHTTTLTFDQDGALTEAIGPRAAQVSDLSIYHLSRERASELFHLLHATHTVYRQPPPGTTPPAQHTTPDHKTQPAQQPAAEPTPPSPATDAPSPPTVSDPRALVPTPLLLRVLGPIDILSPDTSTPARGALTQSLLTLLALHPRGLTTTQLADLAWNPPPHSKRAVYAALDRLRDLIRATTPATHENNTPAATDPIPADHTGRYRLDPDQITTDLTLQTHLEERADHTNDPTERRTLLNHAADLHRGPLADGLDDDTRDWLTTARHQAHLHTAHLHLRCADTAADTDPATTLEHVRQAVTLAPDDETTLTDAIRLYRQLGHDDLARALARHRTG